jgi:hypothetical protein
MSIAETTAPAKLGGRIVKKLIRAILPDFLIA